MTFVDTGYFVALFEPSDALHATARAWADILDEPLIATEYVLLEVANRFSKPADRTRAIAIAATVRAGPDYHFVPASAVLLDVGLAMFEQHADKAWSLTDCISFHVMRDRRVRRALSYDHHFAQAGFDALLRRDP